MLKISLVYPGTSLPAVAWKFASLSTVRIGRAPDNDVVLFSSFVSRYHLEISHDGQQWKILNLGRNGFSPIDGHLHDENKLTDNVTVQLAKKGPKLIIQVKDFTEDDSVTAQALPQQQNIARALEERFKVTLEE